MKIFTVGSKSFVTSFQLAGVPGIISDTPKKTLDEIKSLGFTEIEGNIPIGITAPDYKKLCDGPLSH